MNNSYSAHGNKNRARLFAACLSGITGICVVLSLTACGQRGALYIPSTPEAAQRSTLGDVLTTPTKPMTPMSPMSPTTAPKSETATPETAPAK